MCGTQRTGTLARISIGACRNRRTTTDTRRKTNRVALVEQGVLRRIQEVSIEENANAAISKAYMIS